jgi:hypothetical protein
MVGESTGPTLPTRARERAELASNRSAPVPVLRALLRESGPAVRRALAENPSTPQDVLVALAKDERRFTRLAVANNPSAPEEALIMLVSDLYNQVRWTVPLHRNCGPSVQRAVAASEDSMARQNLAGMHPADDVAAALAGDPDPQVRGRLAAFTQDPELLAGLIADPSDIVRAGATENRLLSRGQMLTLAKDRSRRVRGHLAAFRSALPHDIRALLARDNSVDVRFEMTMRRQPEPIAEVLRNDTHPDVVANMEQWGPNGVQ